MIKIIWPDGNIDVGQTWKDVLQTIRRNQWTRQGRIGFRLEMAKRALAWAGKRVPLHTTIFGSDATFGRALAATGLYEVLREDDRIARR